MWGLTSLFPDRESWSKENFTDYYIISSFFISKKRLSKAKFLSHFFEIKKPTSYANRFSFAEKEGFDYLFQRIL